MCIKKLYKIRVLPVREKKNSVRTLRTVHGVAASTNIFFFFLRLTHTSVGKSSETHIYMLFSMLVRIMYSNSLEG